MKKLLVIILGLASPAYAQTAIQQTGAVVNNSSVMWASDHHIRQAAGAAGDVAGKMITGGFSAVGNVCSFSNTTDQSGISLCLDSTNGQLVYNGTAYPISGGGGNVTGPASSTLSELAGFNNTAGTLLKSTGARTITGSNTAWLFDPTQSTQQFVKFTGAVSGTMASAPSDTNGAPLLWFNQSGAIVGRGINTSVTLAEFDITDTGTLNNSDSYVALAGNARLTTTRSGAGWTGAIGVSASANGAAYQGGVLPGASKGEVHGANIVAVLSGAASAYTDVIGTEIDVSTTSTTTVLVRQGAAIFDFGDGAGGPGVQGTSLDAAVVIGNRASVGWKNAIYLTTNVIQTGGAFPLSNDGCILCTDVMNAAQGIDLTNVTISGVAFRGPGANFYVTGAGDVLGKSISATGGFIADAVLGSSAVIDFRTSGTSNWVVGRESTTSDFIIKNNVTADVLYRINAGTGAVSLVSTGNMSIVPASTKTFAVTTSGAGGTLALTSGAGNMTFTTAAGNLGLVTGAGDLNITLGGGKMVMTGITTVAAGTAKSFLCIDPATKKVFEGTGASCN